MHDEDGEISIEDLNGVVKYLIFDELVVLILFDVFGVYFGLALDEQLLVALLDDGLAFVVDLLLLHFVTK